MNPEELETLRKSDELLKEAAKILRVKPDRVVPKIKDMIREKEMIRKEIKRIQKLLGPS